MSDTDNFRIYTINLFVILNSFSKQSYYVLDSEEGFCDKDDEGWLCCGEEGCVGGLLDGTGNWACDYDDNCVACDAKFENCGVEKRGQCVLCLYKYHKNGSPAGYWLYCPYFGSPVFPYL